MFFRGLFLCIATQGHAFIYVYYVCLSQKFEVCQKYPIWSVETLYQELCDSLVISMTQKTGFVGLKVYFWSMPLLSCDRLISEILCVVLEIILVVYLTVLCFLIFPFFILAACRTDKPKAGEKYQELGNAIG